MSLKINKRVNGQRVCCDVMCRFERYRGRDHGGVMILTENTQMTNTTKEADEAHDDNDTATLTTPSSDTKTTHNIAKRNSQWKAF